MNKFINVIIAILFSTITAAIVLLFLLAVKTAFAADTLHNGYATPYSSNLPTCRQFNQKGCVMLFDMESKYEKINCLIDGDNQFRCKRTDKESMRFIVTDDSKTILNPIAIYGGKAGAEAKLLCHKAEPDKPMPCEYDAKAYTMTPMVPK